MDPLTAMAASGLRSRMESLDLLANNMANASTGGYKADREFYSLYSAAEAQDSGSSTTMPVIEKPWIDLSQGRSHLPAAIPSSHWREALGFAVGQQARGANREPGLSFCRPGFQLALPGGEGGI